MRLEVWAAIDEIDWEEMKAVRETKNRPKAVESAIY